MEIIFEWDARKAKTTVEKHKVSFEEAQTIFIDPLLVTFPDEFHSNAEERFTSIGISAKERLLLVVHTEQEELKERVVIRIISCRKATTSERMVYEKGE
ncbi:MAG TPA: BrnT family toxin [Anaerolineales bacterium]|nr:BrnT family toxin [Anaerolineales bacterium]